MHPHHLHLMNEKDIASKFVLTLTDGAVVI